MVGEKGCNSVTMYFSNNLQFQIAVESNSLFFRERPQETRCLHLMGNTCEQMQKAIALVSHTLSLAAANHALPLRSHSQSKLPCLCRYSVPLNTLLLFHIAYNRTAVNEFGL